MDLQQRSCNMYAVIVGKSTIWHVNPEPPLTSQVLLSVCHIVSYIFLQEPNASRCREPVLLLFNSISCSPALSLSVSLASHTNILTYWHPDIPRQKTFGKWYLYPCSVAPFVKLLSLLFKSSGTFIMLFIYIFFYLALSVERILTYSFTYCVKNQYLSVSTEGVVL